MLNDLTAKGANKRSKYSALWVVSWEGTGALETTRPSPRALFSVRTGQIRMHQLPRCCSVTALLARYVAPTPLLNPTHWLYYITLSTSL